VTRDESLLERRSAEEPRTPTVAAGLLERRGGLEFIVLPHTYDHLLPVLEGFGKTRRPEEMPSTDVPARRG